MSTVALAELDRTIETKASLPDFVLADESNLHTNQAIASAVNSILFAIGEDPDRQGLLKTPERVARAYEELTSGYRTDPIALINEAIFNVDYHEMVLVKDIEFFSLCEHHILPFWGIAHVAYIPDGKVIGLSKIPRIVDMFSRRLQVQERMTTEIATFVQDTLNPSGVAVFVEGQHMCAMMRGVKKSGVNMSTRSLLGIFKTDASLRAELLSQIGNR